MTWYEGLICFLVVWFGLGYIAGKAVTRSFVKEFGECDGIGFLGFLGGPLGYLAGWITDSKEMAEIHHLPKLEDFPRRFFKE